MLFSHRQQLEDEVAIINERVQKLGKSLYNTVAPDINSYLCLFIHKPNGSNYSGEGVDLWPLHTS